MTSVPVVFVVDDDPSVRSSLKFLISTVGLQVETFDSAEAALQRVLPDATSCLVLDVRLRGLSGLDLQHELAARNCQIPIVFMALRRNPTTCPKGQLSQRDDRWLA
jgi:FixJ family two-component response regulator